MTVVKKGRNLSKVVWPSSSSGPLPRQVAKIGRNAPCPCGSGKKYKDCHERDGEKFLTKLAMRQEKQRRREHKAQLKADGVPWFRRIFH